jgi:hypothetical protein
MKRTTMIKRALNPEYGVTITDLIRIVYLWIKLQYAQLICDVGVVR